MTLRRKILLSQTPLVLALAVIAAGALYVALRFGAAPGDILYENFRSFDAARGMLHQMEIVDQDVLSASLQGDFVDAGRLREPIASFERELRLQESNITEEGETEATERLRRAFDAYRDGLPQAAAPEQLAEHRARSSELRRAVETILQMNRDAMRRKSDNARRDAHEIAAILITTAVVGFLLAVIVSGTWNRRILTPLRVLERAVDRLARGDFEARIRVEGDDEIASLSASFNEMAGHLAQYRASSLGELLDAHNRLDSVMDSLSDAVVVYDLEGGLITSNEAATRLLSTTGLPLNGLPLNGLPLNGLPDALRDVVREAFDRVRQTGEPYEPASLDAAVELPDSPAARWLLISAMPVRGRGDALTGVTVAFRDVTRARRLEGFKGDLVASAAHELRTPLTSLHMAVHLCLEQAAGPLSDRQQDLLAAARQDCERLQGVVDELLEMARLESGAARLLLSEVNVGELVRDAAARHEAQARREGKTLEVVPGDSLLTIDADSARLMHLLDNLIENAFLHSDEGGRVAIGFERNNGSVKVTVDDAGSGVPPDLRERVFEKFFRVPGTTREGSGLGLSIVRDIVRAHGGDVGVEEAPLGGARFWFSIPEKAQRPV